MKVPQTGPRYDAAVTAAVVPEALQPYVEHVSFSDTSAKHDGVELLLTSAGVRYARAAGHLGSVKLARWLTAHAAWQGSRSEKNVADEIATHALFANWPILGKRANPVNIEYSQTWPASLLTRVRDGLLAKLRTR
jgi:hypothetical protein